MLTHLSIRNIVLITALDLTLENGFCVLTGETGAGKSILLDSLGLLLGNRADSKLIRQGADEALVQGEFQFCSYPLLQEMLVHYDIPLTLTVVQGSVIQLTIRRKLTRDGKGKIFINDVAVGQSILSQIGEILVEIHGQHDQRNLTSTTTHRLMLDSYVGLNSAVQQLGAIFDSWQHAAVAYQQQRDAIAQAEREEDYLRHVLEELQHLAPSEGEEEILSTKRTRLQSQEKLLQTLSAAQDLLTGKHDVLQAIRATERLLLRNLPESINAEPILHALDKAGVELEEALHAIEVLAQEDELGDTNLEQLEERLFSLRDAARKYRCSVDELPAYQQEVAHKLASISRQSEILEKTKTKMDDLKKKYIQCATMIHQQRQEASTMLAEAVQYELIPLKMASCRIGVQVELLDESQWHREGMDKVSVLVSTNAGMPFGSLGKIASGGELSRLMLALKVVLAGKQTTPTLIFDEIDTGIGGAVADAVGRRLAQLGDNAQVLCVTHQPQVAAYGKQHLKVAKQLHEGMMVTHVHSLTALERREEIARMLAGDAITDEARAAAQKLMEVS